MEYEIKPQSKFSFGFKELWKYRELFYFFTWRNIKVKYKQATLGILWAILQPLIMMLTFTLIFSKALKVSSEGIPYPVFALSGLLIWNIFSNGLLNSANSMVANAGIIKKIYFPRLVIPISSILTVLIDFLFAASIYIAIVIYYHQHISLVKILVCLPLSIFITVVTTLGVGIFFAAFNVKYKDFQYVIPFMIQFLLFANPVLYSQKAIRNPIVSWIMKCNPIANAIELFRSIYTDTYVDLSSILLSSVVAILFLLLGIYTFRKTEVYFADLA